MSDLSEKIKEEANGLFTMGRYTQALALYNKAIELSPSSAPLFGNRAAANLKLENYGAAISDADTAEKLDPTYIKARYRRGSALLVLGRVADAKQEFQEVVKVRPTDPDAKAKLQECVKTLRLKAFADAIEVEHTRPLSETLDPESLVIPSEYGGPSLPPIPTATTTTTLTPATSAAELVANPQAVSKHGISLAFVRELMDCFKNRRLIHKRFVWELLTRLKKVFTSYKSLVHVPWPVGAKVYNVCGDTHGQYYDTLNIFSLIGEPSPTNPFVFNGDFVDRGSFSVENVLMLFAWKLLLPEHVHLTRGNHETKNMNLMYGFSGEVKSKYDTVTMDLFSEVFQSLPLAVCLDKRVLVVHGGLFQKDGVLLDEISAIDRFREPPEGGGLMSDLMWSDPQPFMGRGPSKRGVGQSFGPDVTARFLEENGLEYLIRSHEVKDEGYVVEHAGKCITVFSAPNYCDQIGNKAAVCKVQASRGMPPEFISYSAVPHPDVKPMAYAGNSMGMFGL